MNRIQYAVQFTGNLDIKTVRTTKLTFKIPSKLISMFLTDNNYCIQCTTICQTDSNHCIQCTVEPHFSRHLRSQANCPDN